MASRKPTRRPGSGDYEVGYRRPPKHTRFKPGKSGNPKGRPRGAKGFRTLLQAALAKKLTVQKGGKTFKLSVQEVLIERTIEEAMRHNPKALFALLSMMDRYGIGVGDRDEPPENSPLPEEDQALIAEFLSRLPRSPRSRKRRPEKRA